jgi:hypothetical protein
MKAGEANPVISAPSGHAKAAAFMDHHFTEHALQNPMIPDTQAGFNQLFCEWVIQTDQPFTVGEAPSLAKLFCFVNVSLNFIKSFTRLLGVLGKVQAPFRHHSLEHPCPHVY